MNQFRSNSGATYQNLDYQALLGNFVNGAGHHQRSAASRRFASRRAGSVSLKTTPSRMPTISARCSSCTTAIRTTARRPGPGTTPNSSRSRTTCSRGNSGAQLRRVRRRMAGLDERLRNFVIERNLFSGTTGAQGGRQILASAVNETLRDNVFYMPGQRHAAWEPRCPARQWSPSPQGSRPTTTPATAASGAAFHRHELHRHLGSTATPGTTCSTTARPVDRAQHRQRQHRIEQHRHREHQSRVHERQRQLQRDLRLQAHRKRLRRHDRAGVVRRPRRTLVTHLESRRPPPIIEKSISSIP